MLKWSDKDPDELIDYALRWWKRLDEGDTIAASEWTAPDEGLTITDNTFTSDTTTVWLSGGTLGEQYDVLNRVTTAGGRVMDQTVRIRISAK